MPIYIYLNEKTGETKEVIQSMSEPHVYSENNVKWARVFLAPLTSIDSQIDPFSNKDFIRKTNRKGTIGDLWDLSKEMSEKRTQKRGYDPIKDKQIKAYEKKCHGKKHPLAKN